MNSKYYHKRITVVLMVLVALVAAFSVSRYFINNKSNANVSFLASNKSIGFKTKNGKTYYYNSKGEKVTGWKKITYNEREDWYYFGSQGIMQTGLKKIKWNNVTYLFYLAEKKSGFINKGSRQVGLKKINGYWYYFDRIGRAVTDTCTVINDGRTFCFDKDGHGTNKTTTPTYNKLTKLGTITLGSPVVTMPKVTCCSGPQGFTVAGDYYIATKVNKESTSTYFSIYNKNTYNKVYSFIAKNKFGHTNDLGYNSQTDTVITGMKNTQFSLKNALNKKLSTTKLLTKNEKGKNTVMSGIEYDASNNMIYGSIGEKLYVYDDDLKLLKSINKVDTDTPNGIGAYNGKILVLRINGIDKSWDTNLDTTANSLDIYRINGDYLGSYLIYAPNLEAESISYKGVGNTFALYFGPNNGYIYEVNINIPE